MHRPSKQALINFWHPLRRPLYFIPHLTLLAAVVIAFLVGFGAGFGAGVTYNSQYYRSHNHAFLPTPTAAASHAHVGGVGSLPDYHWVPRRYVVAGLNQGNTVACGAVTNAEDAAFIWNKHHPKQHVSYSYRWLFWYAAGPRNLPTSLEQYNPIMSSYGVLQNKYWDFNGAGDPNDLAAPPNGIGRYAQRSFVHPVFLYNSDSPGYGGVQRIEKEITDNRTPIVGMDVDGSIFNAATTGEYDPAYSASRVIGGHFMVAVAFDHHHYFRDGAVGGVLFIQSWGKEFGVGWNGARQAGANNGFLWVSNRYLAGHSWEAMSQHYGTTHTGGIHYVPPQTKPVKAPPAPKHIGGLATGTAHVFGIRTADTGVDISGDINSAAAQYGFSAPGFAALMGVESGIRQYAPHYPINGAGYCDYSAGLVQITVCTAGGAPLYIGTGQLTASNIQYVFWYLQSDPHRAVWAAAKLLYEFKRQVCWDFPALYASWNMGPGYGCYNTIYEFPTNWITIQAVASFKNWSNWVYAYHVTYGAAPQKQVPQPVKRVKAFPVKSWGKRPHTRNGKLTWAASHYIKQLGHYRGERYFPRRRSSFMKYSFRHGQMYCWMHGGHCKVVLTHKGGIAVDPAQLSCASTGTRCRQYLLHLMNAERAKYGIAPLVLSQVESAGNTACPGATGHSRAMAASGTIWHDNAAYPTVSFPSGFCLPWHTLGQNVGESGGGKADASSVIEQMMMAEPHSYGCTGNHACSIISPLYQTVGIGFAYNGAWYVTEDFVGN